ncbi:hypothetical protein ACFQ07_01885 [Actinomadura adrarensis]|uniref:ATP/GTP-binding protein n=1 Tax=Actinomadura adrarensis TaxID=1819600 RepID=A0ABW3CAK1_9ACTN
MLPPIADRLGFGVGVRDHLGAGGTQTPKSAPVGIPAKFYWVDGDIICRPGEVPVLTVVCFPHRPSGPGSAAQALALSQWRHLPVPAPVVRTAPPRRTQGLVGLPHWFWVTNWRTLTDRARAGGSWVEIVARPQSVIIDPGDGQPTVRCSGPGNAYNPAQPAESQRPECSYTFPRSSFGEPDGVFRTRVTVVWGGTWTGSGGTGGELPLLNRSTSFPIRVVEAQSLYR